MSQVNNPEYCEIHLTSGAIISGVMTYCGQLGTKNWHYYKNQDGYYYHIRAEHIAYVRTVDKT